MRIQLTLAFTAMASAASAQTLTIYAYDSFTSEWGPGPAIAEGFAAECGCEVRFVPAGDGAALLSRLMLEGAATEADVVVGLDNFLMERARATDLFLDSGVSAEFDLPGGWQDPVFVPFDWGVFAFVAGRETAAPASLSELADSDLSIVIQDPRSSTPGLGMVLWAKALAGEDAPDLWARLADNIVTVTPGWTEAYNLFLEGEADAVLSYTTSPAYHVLGEGDETKTAWVFDEGHLVQVEVAAALTSSDQPELARQFLAYLAGPAAQAVIPETNWMFPVILPEGGIDPAFGDPELIPVLPLSPADAAALRDSAVEDWRQALSQ